MILASTAGAANKTPSHIHGPLEGLQETLIQSADEYRLLAAAERRLQSRDYDFAFRALLEVFSSEWDSFTPVHPEQPVVSTRRAALKILLTADYSVRTAWNQFADPDARRMLNQALAGSAVVSLHDVYRRFPLTESGFQAGILQVTQALSHGRHREAGLLLQNLQQQYQASSLPFSTAPSLSALEKLTAGSADKHAVGDFPGTSSTAASIAFPAPWPRIKWAFREDLTNAPEVISSMGGLTLPENRDVLTSNSWKAQIHGDLVVFRSPLRIVALDRNTGQPAWSVRCDTLRTENEITQSISNTEELLPVSARDVARMSDLADFTCDGEVLFFLDRFRRFSSRSWLAQRRFRIFGPGAQRLESAGGPPGATRLVAMRLKPTPGVLWTVELQPPNGFQYRVTATDAAPQVFDTAVSGSSAPDRHAHRASGVDRGTDDPSAMTLSSAALQTEEYFLGAPLLQNGRLFLLSADVESVWLNCLSQATGRFLFRRPVLYTSSTQSAERGQPPTGELLDDGASICGFSGDNIICAVRPGLLVAVSQSDGTLAWATNLADETDPDNFLARRSPPSFASLDAAPVFTPVVSGESVIWSAADSLAVRCINAKTGDIKWSVDRELKTGGSVEGSMDHYCAGVAQNQWIMVGARHIRALSKDDGKQLWILPVRPQTGRVTVTSEFCLVPQQDGKLACVAVQDGRLLNFVDSVFPQPAEFIGSLSVSEDIVCCTTPLSVTAYPTAWSALSQVPDQSTAAAAIVRAQALILHGSCPEALRLLAHVSSNSASPEEANEATRLLAETVLQLSSLSENKPALDAVVIDWLLSNSDSPALTANQKYRLWLLLGSDRSFPPTWKEPRQVILNRDWQARRDILALTLKTPDKNAVFSDRSVKSLSLPQLERVTAIAGMQQPDPRLTESATQLIKSHQPAAAELVLLSMLRSQPDNQQLKNQIAEFRRSCVGSIQEQTTTTHNPFSTLTADRVVVEESLALSRNSRLAEVARAGRLVVDVPGWYPAKLFQVNRQLFRVDMDTGAVHLPTELPASVEFAQLNDGFSTSGILPIVSSTHVGAVTLLTRGSPRLLWWKRIERLPGDVSPVEAGPHGEGYLTVATASRLWCFHPLTGATLWSRTVYGNGRSSNMVQPVPRLVGDGRCIGVMGARQQSCEVFRTADGAPLATVFPNVPAGQVPLIAGSRMLIPRQTSLSVFDLLTGKEIPAGPYRPALLPSMSARLLPNNRALFLTRSRNIVVINLNDGKVELECEVGDLVGDGRWLGLSAIERDDLLFVTFKDFAKPERSVSASSSTGEWRIDAGTLVCISRSRGTVLWHRQVDPAVMPRIHGDASPVVLLWSFLRPSSTTWHLRLGGNRRPQQVETTDVQQDSLRLQLLDAATGRLILEKQHFAPVEPLRCVHHADQARILLESDTNQISIDYSAALPLR